MGTIDSLVIDKCSHRYYR